MTDCDDLRPKPPSPLWRLCVTMEADEPPRLVARLDVAAPAQFEIEFGGLELRSAHGPRPALVWRSGTPLSFESVRMRRLSPAAAMAALTALQERLTDGPDVPLDLHAPAAAQDEPRVRRPATRRLRSRR